MSTEDQAALEGGNQVSNIGRKPSKIKERSTSLVQEVEKVDEQSISSVKPLKAKRCTSLSQKKVVIDINDFMSLTNKKKIDKVSSNTTEKTADVDEWSFAPVTVATPDFPDKDCHNPSDILSEMKDDVEEEECESDTEDTWHVQEIDDRNETSSF